MGIGQGIAVELARRGAEVAVHYAHTESGRDLLADTKLGQGSNGAGRPEQG